MLNVAHDLNPLVPALYLKEFRAFSAVLIQLIHAQSQLFSRALMSLYRVIKDVNRTCSINRTTPFKKLKLAPWCWYTSELFVIYINNAKRYIVELLIRLTLRNSLTSCVEVYSSLLEVLDHVDWALTFNLCRSLRCICRLNDDFSVRSRGYSTRACLISNDHLDLIFWLHLLILVHKDDLSEYEHAKGEHNKEKQDAE